MESRRRRHYIDGSPDLTKEMNNLKLKTLILGKGEDGSSFLDDENKLLVICNPKPSPAIQLYVNQNQIN